MFVSEQSTELLHDNSPFVVEYSHLMMRGLAGLALVGVGFVAYAVGTIIEDYKKDKV